MDSMRFEGRELGLPAEPVEAGELKDGRVYYCVSFVDKAMLIPRLHPFVFVGRNLDIGDKECLYFQDVESHRQGLRYRTGRGEDDNGDAVFERRHEKATVDLFEYERALDVLMVCALRRREASKGGVIAGRDHPSEASSLRMFYEAREIKPYAEHVNADRLEEGAVYFSCMFLDDGETGSPVLEPLVFIGRNLLPEDVHGIETTVYFQDAHSYLRGARHDSSLPGVPMPRIEGASEGDATWFFEYERALDQLIGHWLQRHRQTR